MINLGHIIKRLEYKYNNISNCLICSRLGHKSKTGLFISRCAEHKDLFFCHQCGNILSVPLQRLCLKCAGI